MLKRFFLFTFIFCCIAESFGVDYDKLSNDLIEWRKDYHAKSRQESISSRTDFYTESFEKILSYGPEIASFMMQKFKNGNRDLIVFFSKIFKTEFDSYFDKQKKAWIFPDYPQYVYYPAGFHPDKPRGNEDSIWIYWWDNGRRSTAMIFEKKYQTYRSARKTGNDDDIKQTYIKLQNMGIIILPNLLEKIEAGDADLIPMFCFLCDRNDLKTADDCGRWWESSKERYKDILEYSVGNSGDSSVKDFADELAALDKVFESVRKDEKFNPFSPRQRAIFERRDQLYQRVADHVEKKIRSMDFDDIVPFFQTETSSIKNLTTNKIREFLSDNSPEKERIQEKLLLFLIDYSDEDHGLLLLEVCSQNPFCRNVLKPHLKKLFLEKNMHPFLLEFLPELYQCEEITSLFEIRNEHVLRDAFNHYISSGESDFKSYHHIAGLLLLARNGNKFAEDSYFLLMSTMKAPVPYRALAGCAIISSGRSFDFLFVKLNDFRRDPYTGHPVSLAAVSLLHETLADFPPGPGKWFRGPFTRNDAREYIDWTKINKNSYKVKILTPYDLFSLLALRFQ